mgnify:CR=1 FL=1
MVSIIVNTIDNSTTTNNNNNTSTTTQPNRTDANRRRVANAVAKSLRSSTLQVLLKVPHLDDSHFALCTLAFLDEQWCWCHVVGALLLLLLLLLFSLLSWCMETRAKSHRVTPDIENHSFIRFINQSRRISNKHQFPK